MSTFILSALSSTRRVKESIHVYALVNRDARLLQYSSVFSILKVYVVVCSASEIIHFSIQQNKYSTAKTC